MTSDKDNDSHSRRGSGRGVYANVDQSPLSRRICEINFYFPVSMILEVKSLHISFKSVRISVTIRRKTWHAQLGNCQNRNSHTSKIVCLLSVCLINDWHLGDHISEPYIVLWKTVNNCARNRSRSDEIDIQTEICTSLKYKILFHFSSTIEYKVNAD